MGLRVAVSMVLVLLGLMVLSVPAFAGGFAVTTFDQLPTTLRADGTYRLGYTIRQHGMTPLPDIATRVVARRQETGQAVAFVGAASGAPGHYVVEVRFPTTGVWSWQVEQGPFAPQSLGSVSVLSGPPGPPDADLTTLAGHLSAVPALRAVLPLATALALVLFAWRLAPLLRRAPTRLDRHAEPGAWHAS
jgi:hypothetical protein